MDEGVAKRFLNLVKAVERETATSDVSLVPGLGPCIGDDGPGLGLGACIGDDGPQPEIVAVGLKLGPCIGDDGPNLGIALGSGLGPCVGDDGPARGSAAVGTGLRPCTGDDGPGAVCDFTIGLGPCLGDDQLGPSIGDDTNPALQSLGPCLGDDTITGQFSSLLELVESGHAAVGFCLGASTGDDGVGNDLSDRRLKCDLTQVGSTVYGLPLYHFRYKGRSETYEGVMAQDVLQIMPAAVSHEQDGYYRVNYELLGAGFRRLS